MEKNNKKILSAWTMYDWANSVYPLVISSAIFPVYYTAVTTIKDPVTDKIINDNVEVFGSVFKNTVISNYVLALSFLIICITSPLLSGIADSRGNKKKIHAIFLLLGGGRLCRTLFFNQRVQQFALGTYRHFLGKFWILEQLGFL